MKIHLSNVYLVKNKKERTEQARNLPPLLKGRDTKPKYTAPDITREVTVEMVTTGTEEEVIADPFYLKKAIHNKQLTGSYKIVKVVHIQELSETVYDMPEFANKEVKAFAKEEKEPYKFSFPKIKF